MLEKVKRILFFNGIDSKNYQCVAPKINQTNRTMVTVFSTFALVLITIVFILTFLLESVRQNRMVYVVGIFLSLLLVVVSTTVAKKYDWIVIALVHISFSIFFIYGIAIGAVTDPDQKTVTFMVMLILMPTIFITKPIRLLANIGFYVALFALLCLKYKNSAVLSTDIMDAVIFGLLGVASGTVLSYIKIKGYVLEHRLWIISHLDELTQMNNRNSYESDLPTIPEVCTHSLACIYIDVNGLHEMNNSLGHKSGDEMLKFVAKQIKTFLGERFSYRIGGDEFVAFVPDPDSDGLHQNIATMLAIVKKEGYHVAVGIEIKKIQQFNMDELIKSAEDKMYKDKQKFYREYQKQAIRNRFSPNINIRRQTTTHRKRRRKKRNKFWFTFKQKIKC